MVKLVAIAFAAFCLGFVSYVVEGNHQAFKSKQYEGRHQSLLNADANSVVLHVYSVDDPNAHPRAGDINFNTVSAAIDWITYNSSQRYLILIGPGIYREKITIPKFKDFIHLAGVTQNIFDTVIVYNANHGSVNGTGKSATFDVLSNYFIAEYITFQNDAPFANPGDINKQAVALKLSGDFARISNCFILSSQDTLFDDEGRHFFQNTYIEGNIDYIFGSGRSLYEKCNLISNSNATTSGSLTAQGRSSTTDFPSGYSFHNCYIGGTGKIILGRPWGNEAFVVFINCYMESVVDPIGWAHWNDVHGSSNSTAFFAEYQNYGPGSSTSKRVNWTTTITEEDAKAFSSLSFIDGQMWL
ncbi:hypothetical protein SELMODRAFT_402675 [Selaginella moellendorffii]|uniref:pectinesterase n=1 Tax=Selaginella moellendorffii TaxID=88036 RepID=D8QMP0_SELML|nr:hypothetical protein SELMODRAFT_402675 [Selaginella moellendorffii]